MLHFRWSGYQQTAKDDCVIVPKVARVAGSSPFPAPAFLNSLSAGPFQEIASVVKRLRSFLPRFCRKKRRGKKS